MKVERSHARKKIFHFQENAFFRANKQHLPPDFHVYSYSVARTELGFFEEDRRCASRGDAVEREETGRVARALSFFPAFLEAKTGNGEERTSSSLLFPQLFPTAAHYDFPTCCASRGHDVRGIPERNVRGEDFPMRCHSTSSRYPAVRREPWKSLFQYLY